MPAVKWPRTYAPVSRVSCECACATLEAAGLTTQGGTGRSVACTESTRGACRSAHGPCHKTADKLSRVVCIVSALSFRGFRPDMNFDHCAKRGRGDRVHINSCERAVTPLDWRVWARGALRLRGSTQSWCGTNLFEMCSPRGAHLPHGLRGDKGEQLRKHGVTGV